MRKFIGYEKYAIATHFENTAAKLKYQVQQSKKDWYSQKKHIMTKWYIMTKIYLYSPDKVGQQTISSALHCAWTLYLIVIDGKYRYYFHIHYFVVHTNDTFQHVKSDFSPRIGNICWDIV